MSVALLPSLEERRAYYASLDSGTRMEKMMGDIALGVAKEESAAITDERDARVWDELEAEMRVAAERGLELAYDID